MPPHDPNPLHPDCPGDSIFDRSAAIRARDLKFQEAMTAAIEAGHEQAFIGIRPPGPLDSVPRRFLGAVFGSTASAIGEL